MSKIEKSDVHYRDIENSGDPEPIVIQESLMDLSLIHI